MKWLTADLESDAGPLATSTVNRERPEPDDQVSIGLAKGWIENCLRNHESCGSTDSSVLPTRVICVGEQGDQTIKVWEPPQGTEGGYVALSYCWGTGATLTCTPQELPRLLEGFSISELPKTLRQAVQITRQFEYEFLWIDSLCILQGGSTEAQRDWVHESARMGQIFASAVVTVSATASSSCDQGLFHPRTCKMPYQRSSLDSSREQESITLSISGSSRRYQDEPIHKRAWVFQERLLSQRMLSYCMQDMMWHCNDGMRWERNAPGNIHRMYKERLQSKRFKWDVIALAYTSRSLTESKDKLPALSAVAKAYHESTNDDYLAGLWRNALPQALLWMRSDIGHSYLPLIKQQAPLEYRAPSWSWASLDCSIWMLHYSDFVAEIIECSVRPATADPFGMVSSGKLVLKSPFLEGKIVIGKEERFHVRGKDIATFWLDENDFIKRHDADLLRPTIAVLIAKQSYHYGLLLRSSKSSPECFVRIGMFCSSDGLEVWENVEKKIFTII